MERTRRRDGACGIVAPASTNRLWRWVYKAQVKDKGGSEKEEEHVEDGWAGSGSGRARKNMVRKALDVDGGGEATATRLICSGGGGGGKTRVHQDCGLQYSS
jgi:hypothetical protein